MKKSLDQPIYLASQSPRRKFLLEQSGFDVSLLHIDVEEVFPDDMPTDQVAEHIASLKMDAAVSLVADNQIVLTADTVVIQDNTILGKPKNKKEASQVISSLGGRSHEVVTGVVICGYGKKHSFSVQTEVRLSDISDVEIAYYIDRCEVLDKAGSYGIQDWIGWTKVSHISGSYANIMGLPTAECYDVIMSIIQNQ